MDGEMDVDLMTLRILSRSGFYDSGEDQEHFWTEMHYYRDHCREGVECQNQEEGAEPLSENSSDDFQESSELLEEFFECWDYWHKLESL